MSAATTKDLQQGLAKLAGPLSSAIHSRVDAAIDAYQRRQSLLAAQPFIDEYLASREKLAREGISLSDYVSSALSDGVTPEIQERLTALDGLYPLPAHGLCPVGGFPDIEIT